MNETKKPILRWTAPEHARVKTQNFSFGHVEGKLTDSKIDDYIREGRYGVVAQQRLFAEDKRKAEILKAKKLQAKIFNTKIESLFDELGI